MAYKKKPELIFDPYQKDGVNFHLLNRYAMNADVPGLGKTRQAIGSILVLQKKTIIVSPAYLIESWRNELAKTELIVQEIKNNSNLQCNRDTEVLIISYYQVSEHRTWLESLVSREGFDFLVVDESHAFKNPEAERTMELGDLVGNWRPNYLLLMTGTPIKNGNGAELYVPLLFKALQPGLKTNFLEEYPSPYVFATKFAHTKEGGRGGFKGVKNEEELRKWLKNFMIRRTEEDAGIVLPESIENEILVEYPEDPMLLQIYEAFVGDTSMDIQMKAETAAIKAPFTASFIDNKFEEINSPIICFSEHRRAIEIIESEMKTKKFGVIMGGMLKKNRDKVIREFQSNKLNGLLCTVGAAKEGLTLVESNNLVENDYPWVPSDITQLRARIRRRGQSKTCFYWQILGCNIDLKIRRMVNLKAQNIKKVI